MIDDDDDDDGGGIWCLFFLNLMVDVIAAGQSLGQC